MSDLEGILVVTVEQAVAAPYCSERLADAGARVIKIERPEGDFARAYDHDVHGESAYFVWLNRGKESVVADLKKPDDVAFVRRLALSADVFIQNLAPGITEKLGIGSASLRADNPRLITVDLSGYGSQGPLRDLKAYDLLVQAESGLANLTGTPEEPARVGVSVCDIAAGMTAYQAVLQALIGRARTGQGRAIEVSLFHALADWMNVPHLQHAYGGRDLKRPGLKHPSIAPYGAFTCRDGGAILIAIQNEREWVSLCDKALEAPGMARDPRFVSNVVRVENRTALEAEMGAIFARFDRDQMAKRLEDARIAYGRLSTLEDLAHHPQARFISYDTPAGPVRVLAPGALHDGALPAPGPVPALGQHDAAVRAEFAEAPSR